MIQKVKKAFYSFRKTFAFFWFGLGSIPFSIIVIPLATLLIHPKQRKEKFLRGLTHLGFKNYVRFLNLSGAITLIKNNTEKLKTDEPCIICANHPSLLDVVFLISMIPQADCIVKADVWKNPAIGLIVSSMFIPNSLDVETTVELCKKSLDAGNNVILFPEGTRTPIGVTHPPFKRSAAQIALRTGHDIVAVRIDCSEDSGLKKGDRFWEAPSHGVIEYKVDVKTRLKVSDYKDLPVPIAARRLTKDMESVILGPKSV